VLLQVSVALIKRGLMALKSKSDISTRIEDLPVASGDAEADDSDAAAGDGSGAGSGEGEGAGIVTAAEEAATYTLATH
jgi:hypothetical protein